MPNYAPRVSVPFVDCSSAIVEWSKSCEKMVVYQHEADEEVERVHLHMIMIDCKYETPEQLKRQFCKRLNPSLKGNALWSWVHKDYPNPDMTFIKYMSNGKLRPVFIKNVPDSVIEEFRSQWIDYSTPKGKLLIVEDGKEKDPKTRKELLKVMLQEYEKIHDPDVCAIEGIAKEIVGVVVKVLNDNEVILCKRKVQEYRDSIMGLKHSQSFIYFVNDDIYRYVKYNG